MVSWRTAADAERAYGQVQRRQQRRRADHPAGDAKTTGDDQAMTGQDGLPGLP
jgi:hypothetical protein